MCNYIRNWLSTFGTLLPEKRILLMSGTFLLLLVQWKYPNSSTWQKRLYRSFFSPCCSHAYSSSDLHIMIRFLWHRINSRKVFLVLLCHFTFKTLTTSPALEDICNFTAFSGTFPQGLHPFDVLLLGSAFSLSPMPPAFSPIVCDDRQIIWSGKNRQCWSAFNF